MTALYEITNALRRLDDISVFDDVPPEVLADTIESLEGDLEVKAVAVAKFILNLEADADKIMEAAAQMQERGQRVKKRAQSVRAYLQWQLQCVQRDRIQTPELVIKRVANPPAVIVDDEAAIPDNYWVTPEPPPQHIDKKAIKDAIRAGSEVPGVHLEQSERLSISP